LDEKSAIVVESFDEVPEVPPGFLEETTQNLDAVYFKPDLPTLTAEQIETVKNHFPNRGNEIISAYDYLREGKAEDIAMFKTGVTAAGGAIGGISGFLAYKILDNLLGLSSPEQGRYA
jgi:uncharacterized protein (DUF169 family)